MNAPLGQLQGCITAARTRRIGAPALAAPVESLQRYQLLRRAILIELARSSVIEWLLSIDVCPGKSSVTGCCGKSSWKAIGSAPLNDACGRLICPVSPPLRRNTSRITHAAAHGPQAKVEIEQCLSAYGFDRQSINVEAYHQAREVFLTFEALIASAHHQRMSLLARSKASTAATNGPPVLDQHTIAAT
jgi:hypothetical protein